MGVIIGRLDVVAAPPPPEPGNPVREPAPGLTAADITGVVERRRALDARREAD